MGKRLGTHLHLWGFQFTHVYAPSLPAQPKKQRWTRVSRTFRVSTLYTGWTEGELQENVDIDALFTEGTQKLQKVMNTSSLFQGLFCPGL